MHHAELSGHWGEAQAAEYLRRKRYEIIGCNYRSRFGEIDLIAQNRTYIVFVEVKTRRDAGFAYGREYVGSRKQARLQATAQLWLEQHETKRQPRFDVIEVYAPQGMATRRPQIIHIENAF